jgi:hypothetical protein
LTHKKFKDDKNILRLKEDEFSRIFQEITTISEHKNIITTLNINKSSKIKRIIVSINKEFCTHTELD